LDGVNALVVNFAVTTDINEDCLWFHICKYFVC
jgi:hypothetical protein